MDNLLSAEQTLLDIIRYYQKQNLTPALHDLLNEIAWQAQHNFKVYQAHSTANNPEQQIIHNILYLLKQIITTTTAMLENTTDLNQRQTLLTHATAHSHGQYALLNYLATINH